MTGDDLSAQHGDLFAVERLERGRPDPTSGTWAPDPAPLDDELLSSWLSRLAWANAIGPDALLSSLRPALGRNVPDADGALPSSVFDVLSRRTGLPVQRLEAMQRFAHPPGTIWATLLGPAGFCPQCWVEDAIPYVRWRWRAASFRVCTDHGVWLCGRCPNCQARLSVLHGRSRRPLWHCAECRQDLRMVRANRASAEAVRGQSLILDISDIAEQIGRPHIIEHALNILHGGNVRKGRLRRSARTGLMVLGGSREAAYALLDGIPAGGIRTHLLRLLRGGTLDAALTTDPLPARCWAPDSDTADGPRRVYSSFVSLYDLLSVYGKLRAVRLRVRPATVSDVPLIQHFCRRLCGAGYGDRWLDDLDAEARTLLEKLLAIPWPRFIEEQAPVLLGMDGSAVVGLAVAEGETLSVLQGYPDAKNAFFPVLLDGIAAVMTQRGARRLEAMADQADHVYFEAAGWRCVEPEATPGEARMVRDLVAARGV